MSSFLGPLFDGTMDVSLYFRGSRHHALEISYIDTEHMYVYCNRSVTSRDWETEKHIQTVLSVTYVPPTHAIKDMMPIEKPKTST